MLQSQESQLGNQGMLGKGPLVECTYNQDRSSHHTKIGPSISSSVKIRNGFKCRIRYSVNINLSSASGITDKLNEYTVLDLLLATVKIDFFRAYRVANRNG